MGEVLANRDPHIEVPMIQTRAFFQSFPIVGDQEAQINKEVQESGGSHINVPVIGISQNVSSVVRTDELPVITEGHTIREDIKISSTSLLANNILSVVMNPMGPTSTPIPLEQQVSDRLALEGTPHTLRARSTNWQRKIDSKPNWRRRPNDSPSPSPPSNLPSTSCSRRADRSPPWDQGRCCSSPKRTIGSYHLRPSQPGYQPSSFAHPLAPFSHPQPPSFSHQLQQYILCV